MPKKLKLVKAESSSLLLLLKARLPSMTPVLKAVGKYMLSEPEKVVYQSINEVADASKVSMASVVRLCKELDYSSFAKFKLALASELAARDSSAAQLHSSTTAHSLSDRICEVLRATDQLLEQQDIDQVARQIISARRVLLFGVGASHVSAVFMAYKLTRLGILNNLSTDTHMQAMALSLASANDILLVFSGSGSVQDTNSLARLAKERNLQSIAITNRHKSPLGDLCDRQLVAMGVETPLSSGSLEAKSGQLFIVESIYDAICRLSEEHRRRIQGAADAVSDKQN